MSLYCMENVPILFTEIILKYNQLTKTCGAVPNKARVATTVKTVNPSKQTLSSTMAANFQSFLILSDS